MRARPTVSPTKILFASTRHNERRPVRKVRSPIEQYEAHHGPSVEAMSRCVLLALSGSIPRPVPQHSSGSMSDDSESRGSKQSRFYLSTPRFTDTERLALPLPDALRAACSDMLTS